MFAPPLAYCANQIDLYGSMRFLQRQRVCFLMTDGINNDYGKICMDQNCKEFCQRYHINQNCNLNNITYLMKNDMNITIVGTYIDTSNTINTNNANNNINKNNLYCYTSCVIGTTLQNCLKSNVSEIFCFLDRCFACIGLTIFVSIFYICLQYMQIMCRSHYSF